MQVEIFSLCDAATCDSGKVNILGAFDSVFVKEIPAVHPHCAIVLRVRFDYLQGRDHEVTVNFINADGRDVMPPAKGKMHINFPENQRSVSHNLILNIQGLKLNELGEHAVELTIDGKHEGSLPLFVKKIPQN